MGIFEEKFETKDAALDALTACLVETDGKFSVGGELADAYKKYGKEVAASKGYRERAQKAETELRDAKEQNATIQAQLDEMQKLNPAELQEKINAFATEKGSLKAQLDKALKEAEPLRQQIAAYQKRENDAKIADALRAAATELGVRQEAHKDVLRLATSFAVNENGDVLTADGQDAKAVVAAELKTSPHWQPQSTPGGSQGSGGATTGGANSAWNAAREAGDVEAMITAKLFDSLNETK
ncbi:MAG: hypothetical protein IKU86_12260 [Thermoguttaceae bacterium]|nr:hypothetical protein [Thermoguttaceae bacterium]